MEDIKRVACYIRVSHDEQVRHGLSLDAQHKSLTDYVKKRDYKIVDYYVDEGLTARKTLRKRVQFNRMIEDVKKDKIDLIIFIKLDRWFRNVADYYKTMDILEAHNCTWKCTEEDYDLETSTGRLNLNIRLSMAQNESDQTSDRINYVFESRRREGYVTTGSAPFGYKIENKRYVVNEKEAEILRDTFNYFNKTSSLTNTLNYYRENYGYLAYNRLKKYLKNSAYIGEYKTEKGELIENYTPQIIDKEVFDYTQLLLSKNIKVCRNKHNHEYIFDGLIYCNKCGGKFTKNTKLRRLLRDNVVKSYFYYRCYRVTSVNCDNNLALNEERLEHQLLNMIKDEADKYILENKIKGMKATKKPKDNTSKIQSKLKKLRELYLEDDIDKEEYEERKAKLQDELKKNIESLTVVEEPKDLSKLEALINSDFTSLYNSLDNPNKRRFWATFIDKIYIEDAVVTSIKFL